MTIFLQQAKLDAHDKTCKSLVHFWYGRVGGRGTDPFDIDECSACETYFYNEGLTQYGYEYEIEIWLCECCSRPETE